jgi:hypothetical protein
MMSIAPSLYMKPWERSGPRPDHRALGLRVLGACLVRNRNKMSLLTRFVLNSVNMQGTFSKKTLHLTSWFSHSVHFRLV